MIKFVEVKQIRDFNVMERRASCRFELDEIWINPDSILQIKPDPMMRRNLESGYLPEGLDNRQEFSRINFGTGSNANSVTVVGNPEGIAEQIFKTTKPRQVLRG
tara:strand:- start:312 stop:623 length:312 start_codon:yes stop_codon:yes gene_type:complete